MKSNVKQIINYSLFNTACLMSLLFYSLSAIADERPVEQAMLTTAPQVPLPIKRDHPVTMVVNLSTVEKVGRLADGVEYTF